MADQKKVLILDDEPHIVTYLERLLQDNGYVTASAPDGKSGMELARSERPDLICLDITMPEQSGIAFYRQLKEDEDEELAAIPVVVVTAVTGYGGDPEPFKRFLSSRKQIPAPEAFFSKPIDREAFIKTVGSVLAGEPQGAEA